MHIHRWLWGNCQDSWREGPNKPKHDPQKIMKSYLDIARSQAVCWDSCNIGDNKVSAWGYSWVDLAACARQHHVYAWKILSVLVHINYTSTKSSLLILWSYNTITRQGLPFWGIQIMSLVWFSYQPLCDQNVGKPSSGKAGNIGYSQGIPSHQSLRDMFCSCQIM